MSQPRSARRNRVDIAASVMSVWGSEFETSGTAFASSVPPSSTSASSPNVHHNHSQHLQRRSTTPLRATATTTGIASPSTGTDILSSYPSSSSSSSSMMMAMKMNVQQRRGLSEGEQRPATTETTTDDLRSSSSSGTRIPVNVLAPTPRGGGAGQLSLKTAPSSSSSSASSASSMLSARQVPVSTATTTTASSGTPRIGTPRVGFTSLEKHQLLEQLEQQRRALEQAHREREAYENAQLQRDLYERRERARVDFDVENRSNAVLEEDTRLITERDENDEFRLLLQSAKRDRYAREDQERNRKMLEEADRLKRDAEQAEARRREARERKEADERERNRLAVEELQRQRRIKEEYLQKRIELQHDEEVARFEVVVSEGDFEMSQIFENEREWRHYLLAQESEQQQQQRQQQEEEAAKGEQRRLAAETEQRQEEQAKEQSERAKQRQEQEREQEQLFVAERAQYEFEYEAPWRTSIEEEEFGEIAALAENEYQWRAYLVQQQHQEQQQQQQQQGQGNGTRMTSEIISDEDAADVLAEVEHADGQEHDREQSQQQQQQQQEQTQRTHDKDDEFTLEDSVIETETADQRQHLKHHNEERRQQALALEETEHEDEHEFKTLPQLKDELMAVSSLENNHQGNFISETVPSAQPHDANENHATIVSPTRNRGQIVVDDDDHDDHDDDDDDDDDVAHDDEIQNEVHDDEAEAEEVEKTCKERQISGNGDDQFGHRDDTTTTPTTDNNNIINDDNDNDNDNNDNISNNNRLQLIPSVSGVSDSTVDHDLAANRNASNNNFHNNHINNNSNGFGMSVSETLTTNESPVQEDIDEVQQEINLEEEAAAAVVVEDQVGLTENDQQLQQEQEQQQEQQQEQLSVAVNALLQLPVDDFKARVLYYYQQHAPEWTEHVDAIVDPYEEAADRYSLLLDNYQRFYALPPYEDLLAAAMFQQEQEQQDQEQEQEDQEQEQGVTSSAAVAEGAGQVLEQLEHEVGDSGQHHAEQDEEIDEVPAFGDVSPTSSLKERQQHEDDNDENRRGEADEQQQQQRQEQQQEDRSSSSGAVAAALKSLSLEPSPIAAVADPDENDGSIFITPDQQQQQQQQQHPQEVGDNSAQLNQTNLHFDSGSQQQEGDDAERGELVDETHQQDDDAEQEEDDDNIRNVASPNAIPPRFPTRSPDQEPIDRLQQQEQEQEQQQEQEEVTSRDRFQCEQEEANARAEPDGETEREEDNNREERPGALSDEQLAQEQEQLSIAVNALLQLPVDDFKARVLYYYQQHAPEWTEHVDAIVDPYEEAADRYSLLLDNYQRFYALPPYEDLLAAAMFQQEQEQEHEEIASAEAVVEGEGQAVEAEQQPSAELSEQHFDELKGREPGDDEEIDAIPAFENNTSGDEAATERGSNNNTAREGERQPELQTGDGKVDVAASDLSPEEQLREFRRQARAGRHPHLGDIHQQTEEHRHHLHLQEQQLEPEQPPSSSPQQVLDHFLAPLLELGVDDFAATLVNFYQQVAPEKLEKIHDILEKYETAEGGRRKLLVSLAEKYNALPPVVLASSLAPPLEDDDVDEVDEKNQRHQNGNDQEQHEAPEDENVSKQQETNTTADQQHHDHHHDHHDHHHDHHQQHFEMLLSLSDDRFVVSLTQFYQEYCPERVELIPQVLEKFSDRRDLLQRIFEKYQTLPQHVVADQPQQDERNEKTTTPSATSSCDNDIRSQILSLSDQRFAHFLSTFYQKHNPTKIGDIEKILEKYSQRNDQRSRLLQMLEEKYGAFRPEDLDGSATTRAVDAVNDSPSSQHAAPPPLPHPAPPFNLLTASQLRVNQVRQLVSLPQPVFEESVKLFYQQHFDEAKKTPEDVAKILKSYSISDDKKSQMLETLRTKYNGALPQVPPSQLGGQLKKLEALLRVSDEDFVASLKTFYQTHNPEKLQDVEFLCKRYERTLLILKLYDKYQVVPDAVVTQSTIDSCCGGRGGSLSGAKEKNDPSSSSPVNLEQQQQQQQFARTHDLLAKFFHLHNKERIPFIRDIVERYCEDDGGEKGGQILFDALKAKYGAAPIGLVELMKSEYVTFSEFKSKQKRQQHEQVGMNKNPTLVVAKDDRERSGTSYVRVFFQYLVVPVVLSVGAHYFVQDVVCDPFAGIYNCSEFVAGLHV